MIGTPSQPAPVREGDVLAGKYRVDRVLGVGGMGVVVAATHLTLEEKVALKFLLPQIAHDPDIVTRFLREARAAAKIRSEHVARVSDVGTLENGAPYIVMEYLDGMDLAQRVQQGGPLPVREAIDLVLQACEALAEAHTLGIVHRDLKPANLFLTHRPDGTPSVKVLDFGISKMTSAGGAESGLTKTIGLMGSPLYMSPEQLQSAKDVDARADVWALGVILFELLTASHPFDAETMPQLLVQILSAEPRSMQQLRPELPPALIQVIEHALTKNRDARFSDVATFASAIVPFGGARAADSSQRIWRVFSSKGLRIASAPTVPFGATSPMPLQAQMTTGAGGSVASDLSSGPTAIGVPKKSATLPIVLGAAALVLLAGGVALGVGYSSESKPTSGSSRESTKTKTEDEPEPTKAKAKVVVDPPSEPTAKTDAAPSPGGAAVGGADAAVKAPSFVAPPATLPAKPILGDAGAVAPTIPPAVPAKPTVPKPASTDVVIE